MNDPRLIGFSVLLALLWSGAALAWLFRLAKDRARRVSTLVMLGFALAFGPIAFSKNGGDPPLRSGAAASAPGVTLLLAEVRTNAVFDLSMPSNAVVHGPWLRRGASDDWFWLHATNNLFRAGTNAFRTMRVSSRGTLLFPDGLRLEPFRAVLGVLPEQNWTNAPSRVWHASAAGGARLFAWENAALDRDPATPVSFQAELRPGGDLVSRYDLPHPATDFEIAAFGETALSVRGGITNAATVRRVDGAAIPETSLAELLRDATRFELVWRAAEGNPDADPDADGLSTRDEIRRYGTNPNQADTDGDGLSDASEILTGSDPLDADEDGDGIPDGVPQATWASNPLWETNSPTGRTIRISVISPLSSPATFVFGGLSIPLRENGCWSLSLEKGTLYSFRLFTRGEVVRLSIEPGEETPSLRGTAVFPLRSGSDDEDDGFWLDDPTDAFGAGSNGGEGCMAFPEIVLALPQGIPLNGNHLVGDDICVHSQDGIARLEWSLAPETDGSMEKQVVGEGLIVSGNYLALRIPPREDSASGTISIAGLRWGAISKTISAHRFRTSPNGSYCEGCGHYVPNDVSISLSTNSLVLKHDDLLSLSISHSAPSGVEFSDYRFEIRRQGSSTWQTLGTGRSLNWTARIAGTFEIRGTLEAGGMRGVSSIGTVEVRFPAWNQIAADANVSSAIQSAWDLTLSDCTETPENRAREWAFWILLDTRTGTYSTTTPVHGDWVAFGNGGDVDPDDPPLDALLDPPPVFNGGTYCVAGFHTHTPICYDPNPGWRLAGPSTGPNGDFAAAQQYGMPGLLWDYEPDEPATGRLHTGHNINAPSRLYPVIPPERRPTP